MQIQLPDSFDEFVSWYLAPWRRIGRAEFGLALLAASVPGLIVMFLGLGDSAGSFIEPLVKGFGMMNSGDYEGLAGMAGQMSGATPAPDLHHFDWSGTMNNLLLLAVAPLSRMRLNDMGWFGTKGLVLAVLFNISVVESLLQSVTGYDLLPWGTVWGVLNVFGYFWLSSAKSKPREGVETRIAATLAERDLQAKLDNERRLNDMGMPRRDAWLRDDEDVK